LSSAGRATTCRVTTAASIATLDAMSGPNASSGPDPPPLSRLHRARRAAIDALPPGCRRATQEIKRLRQARPVLTPDGQHFDPILGVTDRPSEQSPVGTIFIAANPRTGSNLLASALAGTGQLGVAREVLRPTFVARARRSLGVPVPTLVARAHRVPRRIALRPGWMGYSSYRDGSFHEYVDSVIPYGTTDNGLFSLKVLWEHMVVAVERHGFSLNWLPQPIHFVHIERRDRVAGAASLAKAERSGVWFQRRRHGRSAVMRYDDDEMMDAYRRLEAGSSGWARLFRDHGVEPIRTTYEALAGSYRQSVADVARQLGLSDVDVEEPHLVRQADRTNDVWIEEFRRRHPELAQIPTDERQRRN